MKKEPFKNYEKETGQHPFIGTLVEESRLRKTEFLKRDNGCNAFNIDRPTSLPLSFWLEQDILEYLKENKIPIAEPYGEIIYLPDGTLKTTGVSRTGCCYCLFGVQHESCPNRFQILKQLEPKIWDYCMKPIDNGGLGLQKILDFINVPSGKEEDEFNA